MTKIEVLNFDYAPLNIEVSSFNGGYDAHSIETGEWIFTASTLDEVNYWLQDIENSLINGG